MIGQLPNRTVLRQHSSAPGAMARRVLCFALVICCATATNTPVANSTVDKYHQDPASQQWFETKVEDCLTLYRFPGNDPANVLPVINDPNGKVYIWSRSEPFSNEEGKVPTDGVANETVIWWNPSDYKPSPTRERRQPCLSLYHELVHARDDFVGAGGDAYCGNTGVKISEVRATHAENELRRKLDVGPRTTHGEIYADDGSTIPLPELSECDNDKQRRAAAETGSPCSKVPPGGCGRTDANPAKPDQVPNPRNASQHGRPLAPDAGSGSDSAGGLPAGGDSAGQSPTGGGGPTSSFDSAGGPPVDSGGFFGDPHLLTLDGANLDFQAVGEFTLASSADLQLHVQVRLVPVLASTSLSAVSAVALKLGAGRLEFTLTEGNRFLVRHDGRTIDPAEHTTTLIDGVAVTHGDSPGSLYTYDAYTMKFTDGSVIWISHYGTSMSVFVRPDARHHSQMTGLVGNFDHDKTNDMRTSDSVVISGPDGTEPPPPDELYGRFANSWRITDQTSLFTYNDGQSTATFTDRDFPRQPHTLSNFTADQQANARELCVSQGITDSALRDACALDILATGQPQFAFAANQAQHAAAQAAGSSPGAQGTPTIPSPTATGRQPLRDGATVTGVITDAGISNTYDLDLGDAKEFYVADWRGTTDGCDQTFTINLMGISHSNFPCTGHDVAFTASPDRTPYRLEIASSDNGTGTYSFILITVKPRLLDAVMSQPVDGNLDVRGRQDIYRLPAGMRQVSITSHLGCNVDIFAGVYDLTTSSVEAMGYPLCSDTDGPYELPEPDHRYAVIVSSPDLVTGPYRITID
jgi:hypothetical protein